ncbi:MAG: gliding motility lipoprotein GldJ, partial [Cyclobacteriaceae bacterium]
MKYSKSFLFLVALSFLVSSCFLRKGGKPTAQNPGQVSTATGLQYTRDKAEGFEVQPYNEQPDAPNM